jgi:hypothetical protein
MVCVCGAHLQALKHYGESVRLGHKAILQSLPRLLTLYFEFGSKMAATKNPSVKPRTAQAQVCLFQTSHARSCWHGGGA